MPTPAPTPTPIPAPANPGPDANAEAEANAQRSRSPSRPHTPLPRPYQALTTQVTDTVVLNAGAGLYVCGKAASVKEGCAIWREPPSRRALRCRRSKVGGRLHACLRWAARRVRGAGDLGSWDIRVGGGGWRSTGKGAKGLGECGPMAWYDPSCGVACGVNLNAVYVCLV